MKHKPTQVSFAEGYHALYEFSNNYGAYVSCNPRTYGGKEGLFEMGVLRDGEVVCDTPITGDVLGWVEHEEIEGILDAIAALPSEWWAAQHRKVIGELK